MDILPAQGWKMHISLPYDYDEFDDEEEAKNRAEDHLIKIHNFLVKEKMKHNFPNDAKFDSEYFLRLSISCRQNCGYLIKTANLSTRYR